MLCYFKAVRGCNVPRCRRAAVKRTALPARLVAAFNKVKIKGIAKKILLNNTFVTSRWLSGEAHSASGAFGCGF